MGGGVEAEPVDRSMVKADPGAEARVQAEAEVDTDAEPDAEGKQRWKHINSSSEFTLDVVLPRS